MRKQEWGKVTFTINQSDQARRIEAHFTIMTSEMPEESISKTGVKGTAYVPSSVKW